MNMMSLLDQPEKKEKPSLNDSPILLIDFSHMSHRNLYVARSEAKNEDYIPFYLHQILQSILYTKRKFKTKTVDVYLCIDSRGNWRKDVYSDYKGNRKASRDKDDFDWDKFFQVQKDLLSVLKRGSRVNVIEVDKAEGDDILYVLSEELSKERRIINVTSDKDLKQVSKFENVIMYDPMKDKSIESFSDDEILNHIAIGDKADNIPSIMEGTTFSPKFIQFLEENDIFFSDVETVQNLEIFESIKEKFIDEFGDELIYKKARFGPKTADKLILSGKFQEELDNNKLIKENFERNRTLINLEYIPEYIRENIIEEYYKTEETESEIELFLLQNYLSKHKLRKIMNKISELL